jgi:tetratricopeptide (TPR) repeat protein
MPIRFSTSRLWVAAALLLAACALAAPARAYAQAGAPDEERRRAFELFAEQQFAEALPLLEKLAARERDDGAVLARYGFILFVNTISEADSPQRRAKRARARATLARALELGFDAGVPRPLVEQVIAGVNPDGSDVPEATSKFSANAEADAAMRAGEAAFMRNDLDAALAAYERALGLDPKLYEAPLFVGDVLLRKGEFERAGEWYARAIRLNPDREQAYRYWGNTLMRQARLAEAREKFVDAIIADPYNPYVWEHGIFRWAQAKAVSIGHPEIEPQSGVTPLKDGRMTITIDPKSLDAAGDGSAAWMWYGMARAAWSVNNHEKFRKEHPKEKDYRHGLREEADALGMVVEAVKNQQREGKVKRLAPALEQLVKLHDDGLLEAYVLFARVRQVNSVADDYPAYRQEHRDKLRRYLLEYLTSGKY